MSSAGRLASLAAAVLLLASCVFSTRYQKRGTEGPLEAVSLDDFERSVPTQLDFEARSIEHFSSPPFLVGIVELTEEGLFNRRQYEQVFAAVQREIAEADNGSLLVVFAHGWHHGCRTCDRDLACFRRVLQQVSRDEQAPGGRGRNVVGVYLGWRGRALLGKPDFLTLWNRKQVAEHIGRTGGREVLNALHEIWSERRETSNPVTMVTVGHSLGGALVLSAVRGRMSGNVYDIMHKGKEGTYRTVRAEGNRSAAPAGVKALRARFGDLLVLVNPAIEANAYTAFDNDLMDLRYAGAPLATLREHELPVDKNDRYDQDQLPILLTVASSADTAVGRFFPIARWISALNVIGNSEVFGNRAERIGLGRYGPQVTHTLRYAELEATGGQAEESARSSVGEEQEECSCSKTWQNQRFDFARTRLDLETEPASPLAPAAVGDSLAAPAAAVAELELKLVPGRACASGPRCRGWDAHSPYLVIGTDASVIREHSDIFNPVFTGFLRKYLRAFERAKAQRPAVAY